MFKKIALVLFFGLVSLSASAGLDITVTRGSDKPTRIAIAPVALSGFRPSDDIAQVVEADLTRSGFFETVERRNMLAFPGKVNDVYYRDWRMLGAEYLVVSSLAQTTPGQYRLEYSLLSITGQKPLWTRSAMGSAQQMRDLAHIVSDEVYEAITGIRGIFSTRMAYITAVGQGRNTRYRLMLADVDGARERLVLESRQPIMSPVWAPNGKELAYVSFETSRPAIFRQDINTGKRQQLTNFRGLNGAPAWSPDGRRLALVLSKDGNPEIYILELATGAFTRMTQHFAIDTEPTWMPDGKSLLFTSDRGGTPQIYKLDIASRRVERLTFAGNYNARSSLSPDGRTLGLVHRQTDTFQIASLDLITGKLRTLTETRLDESPTIAPNGAMLMYATKQGNRGVLAAVSIDAGVKYLLPAKEGDVREPAWSPYLH